MVEFRDFSRVFLALSFVDLESSEEQANQYSDEIKRCLDGVSLYDASSHID
jgi:hypothetical protein